MGQTPTSYLTKLTTSPEDSDLITGQQLTTKESFIESLTHGSYVIQIPNLKQKRRNDLEKLLSIFDQSTSVDPERHILNIKEH